MPVVGAKTAAYEPIAARMNTEEFVAAVAPSRTYMGVHSASCATFLTAAEVVWSVYGAS